MKTLQHDRGILALSLDENQGTESPKKYFVNKRVGFFDKIEGGTPVLLDQFLKNVFKLREEISSQLIAMDDAIEVVFLSLLTGDNAFLLSLPGAAKSTLANMVAEGVNGKSFSIIMAGDLTRNDLFGAFDPSAIQKGEWKRKLAGVATSNIVLFDELFKASGSIRNLLLQSLEEHVILDGEERISIPLLMGLSASNELVEPTPRNAIWDRLLYRIKVEYPQRDQDWKKLLIASGGRTPIQTKLDPEEIMLVQALVEMMVDELPEKVVEAMNEVRRALRDKGYMISPRRFLGWARAAVASALMRSGSLVAPEIKDIAIGKHILWMDEPDIEEVSQIVLGISDKNRALLFAIRADFEALQISFAQIAEAQEAIKLLAQAKRLGKRLEKIKTNEYKENVKALYEQIEDFRNNIIYRVEDFS